MNGFFHRICIQHVLAILVVLLVASPVVAEDCARAVALYNQSVEEQDLAARKRLLKRAIPLCRDPVSPGDPVEGGGQAHLHPDEKVL